MHLHATLIMYCCVTVGSYLMQYHYNKTVIVNSEYNRIKID